MGVLDMQMQGNMFKLIMFHGYDSGKSDRDDGKTESHV